MIVLFGAPVEKRSHLSQKMEAYGKWIIQGWKIRNSSLRHCRRYTVWTRHLTAIPLLLSAVRIFILLKQISETTNLAKVCRPDDELRMNLRKVLLFKQFLQHFLCMLPQSRRRQFIFHER